MGKPLIQQRRGKGALTWRSPKHKYSPRSSFKGFSGRGVVVDLIRDASRTAPLAVVRTEDDAYVIPAVQGLRVGQVVESGDEAAAVPGNVVPLKNVAEGARVFCIELVPGDGGKLVRGAGSSAIVMSKDENFVRVKLPSGKIKRVSPRCRAVVGVVSGTGIREKPVLKAGKKFYMMKAKHTYWPRVSASSMNAVEHPFGGGRKHRHAGKPQTSSRNAPPGRKVGYIAASRTGRKRRK
jgi:large subunit ribosomal protein L2